MILEQYPNINEITFLAEIFLMIKVLSFMAIVHI